MPTPDAIASSMQFREQLKREENAAFQRMARLYTRIFTALSEEVQRLAADIAAATQGAETVTVARDGRSLTVDKKRVELARLQRILNQVEEQVARFGGTVQSELALAQAFGVDQAATDALNLMEASLPDLPPEAQQAITASFTRLPSEAIEAAAGLLDDASPLAQSLTTKFGEAVRDHVEGNLLVGMAAGENPRVIARRLAKNLESAAGLGLKWAMTTIRTAQIKSYQTATHMTYAANSDILPGWIWHSALDGNTCMSCINQHGSEHPVTERLNDHHNGRCAAIPKALTYADLGLNVPNAPKPPVVEKGHDWFARQPRARQIELMGARRFEAWEKGEFDFRDLSQRYDDNAYGELLRETSLKALRDGRRRDFQRPPDDIELSKPVEIPDAPTRVLSDEERVTPQLLLRQQEHRDNVEVAETIREFDEGEANSIIAESLDLIRLEEDLSSVALQFDYVPGRMTAREWVSLSDELEAETGKLLKFSTEARRFGLGQKLRGPATDIAQVGGQDRLVRGGAVSAADAKRITANLNNETKDRAAEYLGSKLVKWGYQFDDIAPLNLEQRRRLLAEIGHGVPQKARIGKIAKTDRMKIIAQSSDKQKLEALAAARQPRTAEGLDMWELYKEATLRGGIDDPPYVPDELWHDDGESTPEYILRPQS